MGKQTAWLRILDLIEMGKEPFTTDRVAELDQVDGKPVDLTWISQHLWALIVGNSSAGVQSQATALAGGEEYNGLELWRRLYINHEGGAEQVVLAGITNFTPFSKMHEA